MGDFLSESDDSSTQGSIFPFLSVLCCVIGTMVLILIAGSLNAAGIIAPEMSKRIEEAAGDLDKLQSQIDDLSKIERGTETANKNLGVLDALTKLGQDLLKIESDIDDAMARMEKVRKETEVIREAPAKKKILVGQQQATAERDAATEAVAAARSEVDGLRGELGKLEAERDGLRKVVAAPKRRILVDGVEGPFAVLDLGVDKLTVHSTGLSVEKGSEFSRAEAIGDDGVLERLAGEMARPENKLYPVLLVRPGAVELHDEAERRFRKWRVDFSREPVDEEWVIDIE